MNQPTNPTTPPDAPHGLTLDGKIKRDRRGRPPIEIPREQWLALRRTAAAASMARRRARLAAAGTVEVRITLTAAEAALIASLMDADRGAREEFLRLSLIHGAKFRANRCHGRSKPATNRP